MWEPEAPDPSPESNPYTPPSRTGIEIDAGEPPRAGKILTFGICSLVSGLLGFVCCAIFGIVGLVLGILAWRMANTETERLVQGVIDPTDKGRIDGGKICGIVGTIFGGLALFLQAGILILYVILILIAAASGEF